MIPREKYEVIKMNDNNEELQIYDSIALAAANNNCDQKFVMEKEINAEVLNGNTKQRK